MAEVDFDVASHEMLRGHEAPFSAVCFHAQQCVEKYLKALLVHHAVDFPKTHDLEALFGMVPNSSGLKLEIADLNLLSSYAVEGRYPGDWELPTREEADAALEIARTARDAVRKCLPVESLA